MTDPLSWGRRRHEKRPGRRPLPPGACDGAAEPPLETRNKDLNTGGGADFSARLTAAVQASDADVVQQYAFPIGTVLLLTYRE